MPIPAQRPISSSIGLGWDLDLDVNIQIPTQANILKPISKPTTDNPSAEALAEALESAPPTTNQANFKTTTVWKVLQ